MDPLKVFLLKFGFTYYLVVLLFLLIRLMINTPSTIENGPGSICWRENKIPESMPTNGLPAIYFADLVTDKSDLTLRETCSISSAARHHPDRDVILYHLSPAMANNGSNLDILRMMPNFRTVQLNLTTLFCCTPLRNWYAARDNQMDGYPVDVLSDAVRYALLYKYGGTFLDTDVLMLRPITQLNNTLAYKYGIRDIGSAVMTFDAFHPLMQLCMKTLAESYDRFLYDGGSHFLTFVYNYYYSLNVTHHLNVTVLSDQAFYPFSESDWMCMFESIPDSGIDVSVSYTVCLFSKKTSNIPITPGGNSLIEIISNENCPEVYKRMLSKNKI